MCVCMCENIEKNWATVARPLHVEYRKDMDSNVSGADCYNVLSWLLFLQKLAERLHISN